MALDVLPSQLLALESLALESIDLEEEDLIEFCSLPNLGTPAFGTLALFQDDFALNLVAPYCAIPRDYLSDTPLLRATWPIGWRYPSPSLSERFSRGEHAKRRCDPGDVQGLVPCLLSSVPQDVPPKADLPLSRGLACHLSFADGNNWQQLTGELGTTHTHSLSRTMLRPM